ncbi:hypothetical protein RIF29_19189 [Crotalaria pallida]|uniref:Uncharacterized protein n=1 Tax=Crotalaria pallida TaxID=3830 RepID=A0AAN9F0B2_CROPI
MDHESHKEGVTKNHTVTEGGSATVSQRGERHGCCAVEKGRVTACCAAEGGLRRTEATVRLVSMRIGPHKALNCHKWYRFTDELIAMLMSCGCGLRGSGEPVLPILGSLAVCNTDN